MRLDARSLGTTLVVAPHPDDESLGCGGLIALLRSHGHRVHLLVTTDGVGSHPNSRQYPPDRLREHRYQEVRCAAGMLGVEADEITFLHCPDRFVPVSGSPGFPAVVDLVTELLHVIEPQTIVVPWRRDRHCDHEASWQILREATGQSHFTGRWLEYHVWLPELGDADAFPKPGEMCRLELDISAVLDQKRQAIAEHRSQTTDLISDDPNGFRLSPETLARFDEPIEIYLEPNDD
ncbi:MAG: PIG-L family deacetylase [Sphaerobacteraceae bacterium]|nr:MAG: PIG-L family deacetylase [Sphaerobacteraceae bacterium]